MSHVKKLAEKILRFDGQYPGFIDADITVPAVQWNEMVDLARKVMTKFTPASDDKKPTATANKRRRS